jgi:hypothetical protein
MLVDLLDRLLERFLFSGRRRCLQFLSLAQGEGERDVRCYRSETRRVARLVEPVASRSVKLRGDEAEKARTTTKSVDALNSFVLEQGKFTSS